MTDPSDHTEPTDDLADALRHELRSSYVPYDDERADQMITQATQAHLLDARRWNAPLAAAAAVVLVGGGSALVAANVGHDQHTVAPGANGGPNLLVCGTAGPLPSPVPSVAPTEAPSATSSSSATSVPLVTLPPSAVTYPLRVVPYAPSSGVTEPTASATASAPPSAVSSPVAPPVPSATGPTSDPSASGPASDPSASDPCPIENGTGTPSTSSVPVPPVLVSTTPALSASPTIATPSSAASTSYAPPIPPVPTKSGETNAVPVRVEVTADPDGTAEMNGPVIPADRRFVVTGAILRNTVPGSTGTLTLSAGVTKQLTVQLQDFRNVVYHFDDQSLTFAADARESVSMTCAGTSACDATVTLFGNYVPR